MESWLHARPSKKYLDWPHRNQLKLLPDGSYQPVQSEITNTDQFYSPRNKYRFSDVWGENSETKSKHFDKDYLYHGPLDNPYHNHLRDPASQHREITYQNTIPPVEHFAVEDAAFGWADWSDNYNNRKNPVNTKSESSSESLGNPGSFNLEEQNNQVSNTDLTQNILKDLGFT